MAMDKRMRIYCARLVTQIKDIEDSIVAQMMTKEEITSTQKFVSIGSKKNKVVSNDLDSIQTCSVTRGILLLLLEDDSMAVRLAGIRAMSLLAVNCVVIR